MRVRLLDPERDVTLEPRLPWHLADLIDDDLELRRLYKAMANDDAFLLDIAQKVVPLTVTDPDVITYRQQVLADCLANRAVVQEMYDIAFDGAEVRRKVFLGGLAYRDPQAILRRSVRMLEYLRDNLKQLRSLADRHADQFRSAGFGQLLAMVREQLADDYLRQLDEQLAELQLPRGVLLSAQLGLGNKGQRHILHQPPHRSWWDKLTGGHDGYGFTLDERDETGAQALAELAGHALNDVANIVTQSADHVQGFFERLRTELAFYLGCANLHDRLTDSGVPTCFPVPTPAGHPRFGCRGLRDVGLCLATDNEIVGNDVDADGKSLIMVTGANEGGKSTFLRSVGAAQVMMQAGMFVAAESFSADVRDAVFTHFKREEDTTMAHGKLDEELARISEIADFIGSGSLLLCNESFASTNEREGSQIARDVTRAMVECGIKVVFVTHLYDLAHSMHTRRDPASLFLRAERRPDGARTFRLRPGEPKPTSHGEDSFRRVFGIGAPGQVADQQVETASRHFQHQ
ncbi:MutS-related protein [Mycobacterium talmoniae]|uniref:DNA mismatch repair protein n=1 Tax=Mycobacterium talmoniae TaxID=1858794 RepID=A0A1S1NME5_9MYCO|nr:MULTISPECIES: DNA mismatch repair protein [Mycobacterium]OHV05166.1 DNA mismatch repair protein [Mycobacterium talmoniae]PQM45110.1 Endonuclease MutS2 [Mycobacterium talmoniae]TDH53606.1 DNA mismatch repair protein [Mycobacterium eburneum]